MARGNRRAPIFEDDEDRSVFLRLLDQTADRYDLRIYAACLMGNHYHVVGATPKGNLSEAMRFLNGVYAQTSNRRHARTGHVFEARFRSLVVQRQSYLKRVARYVVLNPVRAGLVHAPGAWAWSTYRATAGLDPAPTWLCLEWLEWAFDAMTNAEAAVQYQHYVNEPPARKHQIDAHAMSLGSTAFQREIAAMTRPLRPDRPLPRGHHRQLRPTLLQLLSGVGPRNREFEQAAWTAHVTHGYPQGEIARLVGLDPSTVSRILRRLRERAGRTR
jgi:putative transposase